MNRVANQEDTRTRILNLAIAAIDAGGEAAIRVNHLVAAAGVRPPVLYHYFGSRDGLVIAAQVERYSRRTMTDATVIREELAACTSRDELKTALVRIWTRIIAERVDSRWVRTSALGSAFARPELEAAILQAQDRIVAGLCEALEPGLARGWLRPGIDLVSAVAWQHSVLMGRVNVERGQTMVDTAEWDRLTIEAFVRAFFGD